MPCPRLAIHPECRGTPVVGHVKNCLHIFSTISSISSADAYGAHGSKFPCKYMFGLYYDDTNVDDEQLRFKISSKLLETKILTCSTLGTLLSLLFNSISFVLALFFTVSIFRASNGLIVQSILTTSYDVPLKLLILMRFYLFDCIIKLTNFQYRKE